MKIEAVRASADALGEKGFVKVIKSVEEIISLTEEGTDYAKAGLPERRLLEAIGPGKPMSELKDTSMKIGLGWLRKKGWVSIDKGTIKPTGQAKRGEDEEILDILYKETSGPSSTLDQYALSTLKKRGLVKSIVSKSWQYSITNEGKSPGKRIDDYPR